MFLRKYNILIKWGIKWGRVSTFDINVNFHVTRLFSLCMDYDILKLLMRSQTQNHLF